MATKLSPSKESSSGEFLLKAEGLTKYFGHHAANDGVDFAIRTGEIHALLGENGAGKSTFVKMLYGVQAPDSGRFIWDGVATDIASPKAARAMGIAMVFQHFSLFPALTVAENIALALDEQNSLGALTRLITQASNHWGLGVDPKRPVGALSVGEQQRVEILRCLLQNPKLLIMDEPTSVLTPQESQQLFDVLKRLAAEGCSVLYISHKLDEIMALAERATVLRGGKNAGQVIPKTSSTKAMAEMMVGDKIEQMPRRKNIGKNKSRKIFALNFLNRPAEGAFSTPLCDISLTLEPGEILGIAGIAGNGQDELMQALSGEWRCPDAEMIHFNGLKIGRLGIAERRQLNIETTPEERNGHAAIADMSLVENTFLTHHNRHHHASHWLRRVFAHAGLCKDLTQDIITLCDVRIPHHNPEAGQLSGGNLQKFIMGRLLVTKPKLAVIAQPSWGVDVGAATMIRQSLIKLAKQGCGIILLSQDLEEIFSLSTTIAVLNNGHLTTPQAATKLTPEKIGLMMGASK